MSGTGKEASDLQPYKIVSLTQDGDVTHAKVQLTFGPTEKSNSKEPITTAAKEDLIREGGEWKIEMWQ